MDNASTTADGNAAQRALHLYYGDKPAVFVDAMAYPLVGPVWRKILMSESTVKSLAPYFQLASPMIAHNLARSRYAEERLSEMRPEQHVIIGAGMDSSAYRTRPPIKIFEVDHPATQKVKKDRLVTYGASNLPGLQYVPIDLEKDSLRLALQKNGFKEDKLTLFSMMGVVPYLERHTFEVILLGLRGAKGSEIIFDAMRIEAFDDRSPFAKAMLDATGKMGEVVRTGYDPQVISTFCSRFGVEYLDGVNAWAFHEMWFKDRKDGLSPWDQMYVVRAAIGGVN